MSRSRLALATLGGVVAVIAGLLTLRGRAAGPAPDAPSAADSSPDAPPPLAAPPLAPSPRRGPETGASARVDSAPTTDTPKPRPARIEGTVVSAETGVPMGPLKVRLDFRKAIGERPRTLEVETDRFGSFAGDLETAEPIPLFDGSADRPGLLFRGFRRTVDDGTDLTTGVEARPGATLAVTLRFASLATWKGVVVDEAGRPLRGVRVGVHWPGPNESPYGSLVFTETNAEGRFTASAIAEPDRVASGTTAIAAARLTFSDMSPSLRPTIARDLRTIPASERESLRIVFPRGRRVGGRLVDESGRAIEGAAVLATYGDPSRQRFARTDADGHFTLEALADGPVTIGAFLADRDVEARLDTDLAKDLDDVVLVARPLDPGDPADPEHGLVVLGARLVDVTDEMRAARKLDPLIRVLVVDRGAGGAFGDEAGVGKAILHIGDSKVVDVRHLVGLVIAEAELASKRNPDFPMIRIVTSCGEGKFAGTNTQHFELGPGAVEHLKRVRDRLARPR